MQTDVIFLADRRRDEDRATGHTDHGGATVSKFPVRGIGARLLDPEAIADEIDRLLPKPKATPAERTRAFNKAKARWGIHVELVRATLAERGIPANAIRGVIADHTAHVREILAARKVRREAPISNPFEGFPIRGFGRDARANVRVVMNEGGGDCADG